MPGCRDAYIRLSPEGIPREFGEVSNDDGLLLIDVERDEPLAQIRNCSPRRVRGARVILVRERDRGPAARGEGEEGGGAPDDEFVAPEETLDELRDVVDRYGLDCAFGVLTQPLAAEPTVIGADISEADLVRARAVELEALLRLGNGVWEPQGYHYRLPSGEHAAGFIRTANAVQSPRDAWVIASWLRHHARAGLGLVLDTGTLTPVALALQLAMAQAGLRAGPVEVLDGYPTTERDVASAVRQASIENAVLALLSVSSSGRILGWLADAIETLGTPDQAAIEVLVSKRHLEATHEPVRGVDVDQWHPTPGLSPLVEQGSDGDACHLCREAPSFIVPILPGSFEGTFEASIVRVTPDLEDATRNRALWEACDRLGAIHVQEPAVDAVKPQRAPEPMAIRIDHSQLIGDSKFREQAAGALAAELARKGVELSADLIIVRQDEFDLPGMRELVDGLPIDGKTQLLPFPESPKGEWSPELEVAVKQAASLAVVSLGAVTGFTLQRALLAAQHHRLGLELGPVQGVVIHARLSDEPAWRSLRNSFNRHLYAAFAGYLPLRSPLEDEGRTLNGLREVGELGSDAKVYFDRRHAFCADPASEPELGLFWGSTPEDQLTPLSVVGEALHPPATYAAIASALEARRQTRSRLAAPEQRMFDLPAIVRSYYDPLILSAILRWLRPREAWWGSELEEAEGVVLEMLSRGREADDLRILVPELLLAGAQGKVARPGLRAVRAFAEALCEQAHLEPAELAPTELGLALVPVYEDEQKERLKKRAHEALSSE